MTPAAAADIALQAIVWLSAQPEAMARLLAETGLDPAAIRAVAADPATAGFALDFLLSDEALLRAFAADAKLDAGAPLRARAALPGGDLPHWT